MKTPFLHLVRRLAHSTPASWFPACLEEATGYALQPQTDDAGIAALTLMPRGERLRARRLASAGALFAAPGLPPHGALLVLPAGATAGRAEQLHAQLAASGRELLDAALADPRLLAHIDLGAPATSIAGLAGLQFLRDRHALAVGHFLYEGATPENLPDMPEHLRVAPESLCVQIAGLPAPLALWLAAGIAQGAGATQALVLGEEDTGSWLLVQRRPAGTQVH